MLVEYFYVFDDWEHLLFSPAQWRFLSLLNVPAAVILFRGLIQPNIALPVRLGKTPPTE
jgi:hypothetical protein